jgi:hypothetical protein
MISDTYIQYSVERGNHPCTLSHAGCHIDQGKPAELNVGKSGIRAHEVIVEATAFLFV